MEWRLPNATNELQELEQLVLFSGIFSATQERVLLRALHLADANGRVANSASMSLRPT